MKLAVSSLLLAFLHARMDARLTHTLTYMPHAEVEYLSLHDAHDDTTGSTTQADRVVQNTILTDRTSAQRHAQREVCLQSKLFFSHADVGCRFESLGAKNLQTRAREGFKNGP